ncbi:sulfatase [Brachybacterium sp. Marseille-Q7125]|uniref:sulfatase family protein n=1 Tax=Brachybacterium sp. Marseille-Q7125 TaxID=2932815 RepID=UPI001FF65AFD|nr:sulfatase [Brachybacterium sp. Marseille-Q7125]
MPDIPRPSTAGPSAARPRAASPCATRPNIVFILSDDHAAHSISAYGSRVNTTPHMDRLAAEGARMDALYCTNSICTPSRASILTGTYSHINRAPSIYSVFDHRVRTFPEVLQEQGYQTAVFGKWHLGTTPEALPRGFDDWRIFPNQGDYWDPEMIGPEGREQVEGYATDVVTQQSLDFLSRRDPERPFCLLVHHKAPHRPWIPHPRYAGRYAEGTIPEPETMWDEHEGRAQVVQQVRMQLDDLTPTDYKDQLPTQLEGEEHRRERAAWKYQRYMRDYLRCVQAVDDSIGQLLEHLEDAGVAENTLFIYTSDQGFFLGDHGWFDKRLMLDESLTMPMLARWPAQIPAGTRITDTLSNVDIAATLLEAAGLDPSAELPDQQGRSFLRQLHGTEVPDWRQAVYYRYWEHDDPEHHAPAHYGVRTPELKYIRYYNDGLGTPGSSDRIMPIEDELYDLVADPREMINVAADPAYAEQLAAMQQLTAQMQAEVGDAPYEGPDTPRLEWPTAR